MLTITFQNKTKQQVKEIEELAQKMIDSVIEILKIKTDVALDISFINKVEALKLNQDYRQENYVPDVISFPSGFNLKFARQIGIYELGDLFICLEVAKQKANYYHHQLNEELSFLFVHGVLHLLGYDHENKKDQKKMFTLQDKILKKNNVEYLVIEDQLDYLEE
jgi:probable rRNA maturation factor